MNAKAGLEYLEIMAQKVTLVLSPGFLLQLHREPCFHQYGPDPNGAAVWLQPCDRFTGKGETVSLYPDGMRIVIDVYHAGLYAGLWSFPWTEK